MQNKKVSANYLIEQLIKLKAVNGLRSIHLVFIVLITALYIFLAYFVFHDFYDVYVIFLFAPLLYTSVVYRLKGAIVGSIFFVLILVPHALPLSLDPYILVRSFIYLIFPFLVSALIAISLNYFEGQIEGYQKILTLNSTLNEYIDKLEKTQKQLIQVEKLRALGQLSASIAHEINNPLAGVLVYTQLLQKLVKTNSLDPEKALEVLSKMETALTYSSGLVRNLLDFSRQTAPDLKPLDISKVIDQALVLVGHQAQLNKVKITRQEAPGIPLIKGDLNQLVQVFVNLVVNAIQSMPNGGELVINCRTEANNFISVGFRDSGYGIPPENMNKLFTPFFSTKDAVKGVGLGLAISYGIIERHGGHFDVQSEVGKGTTFTVFLPQSNEKGPS
jgi:signal transduction histidine kinase